jgi:hypothetical protein
MNRLEERIATLERAIGKLPSRIAVGAGAANQFTIESYDTFPAIPSKPTLIACKGQLWYADSGYTHWTPAIYFSSYTGTPGT